MELRFCRKNNCIKIKSFTFEQVRGGPTNHCTSDLSASFQSGPRVEQQQQKQKDSNANVQSSILRVNGSSPPSLNRAGLGLLIFRVVESRVLFGLVSSLQVSDQKNFSRILFGSTSAPYHANFELNSCVQVVQLRDRSAACLQSNLGLLGSQKMAQIGSRSPKTHWSCALGWVSGPGSTQLYL